MQRTRLRRDKFYTFDIETTTIITGIDENNKAIRNGIIWSGQFYDGVDYIQVRNLRDTIKQLKLIEAENEDNPYKVLVVVHNLSYEFSFIKDFFEFEKVLCTSERKIISAETKQIVFRCSYFLSNMGLEKFLKFEGVEEKYQKSNMDYLKLRYPWTELTEDEKIYCANDVIGLHKAIEHRISDVYNNDLNNLPLTSTGYVRKACRKAVTSIKSNRYRFLKEQLDIETFQMLHEAFRGGNTHANKMFANKVLGSKAKQIYLGMKDIRSSYPTELLTKPFPTRFTDMKVFTRKEFDFYISKPDKWAVVFEVSFKNLRLKNPDVTPVPYISTSKCSKLFLFSDEELAEAEKEKKQGNKNYIKNLRGKKVDNGRLLSAAGCSMIITEVDYRIIKKQYTWDEDGETITRVKVAKKKMLCKELREQILLFYLKKTTLKQNEDSKDYDEDKAYQCARAKEMLNGIYGMHVTNPCKPDYLINNSDEMLVIGEGDKKREIYPHSVYQDESRTEEELLAAYYDSFSSFLSYQVGVYCTAYARESLQEAIDCLVNKSDPNKSDLVYCDTDSIKYLNPEDHEEAIAAINKRKVEAAEKHGAYVDFEGKRYHLGIFTDEGKAVRFITWGAKKYMYQLLGHKGFKITISGVPKKKGIECLQNDCKRGKIKSPFDIKKGYTFHAVKTASTYMDLMELKEYEIDGGKVYYGSNIAMYPTSYTLGLTYDYEILLDMYKEIMLFDCLEEVIEDE